MEGNQTSSNKKLITSSVKSKEAKVIKSDSDPKVCQNQQSLCLTEECIVSGRYKYLQIQLTQLNLIY